MNTITWDLVALEKFRKAYQRAMKAGHYEFTFQDNVFYFRYAEYLIAYLDERLNK